MARRTGGDALRIERGAFVIVPDWVTDHPDVSDRAHRLYCVLRQYESSDDGTCFPKRATLAARLGCSVDTVDRALAELVKAGAVDKEHRTTARGDSTSNLYTVHFDRTGAEGGGTPAATPPPRGRGTELDPGEERDPAASPQGRPHRDEADRIVREWWESHDPRPLGSFMGARKIVEEALDRGHTAARVAVALRRCGSAVPSKPVLARELERGGGTPAPAPRPEGYDQAAPEGGRSW